MLRNRLLALSFLLLAATSGWCRGRVVVLTSHLAMQRERGGILSRVSLETFTDQAPGRPFPVLSGAGALSSWSSTPPGAFELVEPVASAPGSPAFVQKVASAAQLDVVFWTPLEEEEMVLRLPPTPNGTWTLAGLPGDAPPLTGNGAATPDGTTAYRGRIPAEGVLWLSWKGGTRTAVRGVLEASELEVFLEAGKIRFQCTVRGFHPARALSLRWGGGLSWKPAEDEPPGRLAVPGGVDFTVREGPWFEEVFEGEALLDEGLLELQLPRIEGLGPPLRGRVTVTPTVSRRYRRIGGNKASPLWFEEPLGDGARRWILRPGEAPRPLRFRVSGDVPPGDAGPALARVTAETLPAVVPQKVANPFLLRTNVQYRISRPGALHITLPPGVKLQSGRFGTQPVELDLKKKPEPGEGIPLSFLAEEEGTLHLNVLHGQIGRDGSVDLQLPAPGVAPEVFRWTGRLPENLALLHHDGGGLVHQDRVPYPLRWMESLFEGVRVVLTEAGVSVAFGLAGLLALYAFLFLQPPNQRTAYLASVVLAAGALAFNLLTAASIAPGGRNSSNAELEARYNNPAWDRMRDAGRQLGSLFQLHPEAPTGPAGAPHSPQAPGATFGSGEAYWGSPPPPTPAARSGQVAPARSPGVPGLTFQIGGSSTGEALEPEEPPPLDWSFARVPAPTTEAGGAPGDMSYSLRLRVVPASQPFLAAVALGLLALGALAALRVRGGPAPLAGVVLVSLAILPLDLYFPRQASPAWGCLLAGLLAITVYRVALDGIELWERARRELEQRRLRALSRSGSMTRSAGGRDTGGGLYSGPNLQKNECTYEDVFRDDEGITFIMGDS